MIIWTRRLIFQILKQMKSLFDDGQIASIFSFAEKHSAVDGRFIFDRNVIKNEHYNDYECKVNCEKGV